VLKEIKMSEHKFALNELVTPLGPTSNRYYYSNFKLNEMQFVGQGKGDEISHLMWSWVVPLEK